MKSIFEAVSSKFSHLERSIYSRPSMLAISHAIEDVVMKFELNADLFVSFEKFQFFLYEKERYLQLEKHCAKVFVFARGIDYSAVTEFSNTIFVEIPANSPLADEWSIIVNHPKHTIMLTTTEQYDRCLPGSEDFRFFKGFLSFSPAVVKVAVNIVVENLKWAGVEYRPYEITDNYLTEGQNDANQKLYLFINQLLNKMEFQVAQVLQMNTMLHQSLNENKQLSFEMVQRLCYAAEFRDDDAKGHLARISSYAALLYSMVETKADQIERMRYAALMHDIGKIGIPDAILLKPGRLTPAEFEIVKSHTTIGSQILRDSSLELIQMGCAIAQSHHEKWDGSGYPSGLAGKSIPLPARVVAIVDVFDALSSKRVYKEAYPLEQCLAIIRSERNKHFDGELAELFLDNISDFLAAADNNQHILER